MTSTAIETTRPTTGQSTPIHEASAGSQNPASAISLLAPSIPAPERGQTTRPTIVPPTPMGDASAGSQPPAPTNERSMPMILTSGRDQISPQARQESAPILAAPAGFLQAIDDAVEADAAFLALLADVVDDLERIRIANQNRLRHLTRDKADSDGEVRGLGLDIRNPHVRRIAKVVGQIESAEHDAVLALQNLMRRHPLGPWVKATPGVGEKQAARLLAAIGDPYIRPELTRADGTVEPSRPRMVSELWAFCGLHVLPAGHPRNATHGRTASGTDFPARHLEPDTHIVGAGGDRASHPDQAESDTHMPGVGVAPKRQRGQRVNWSTTAKTRAYLIAESCIKQRQSPFRQVYDATRVKYADAVHGVPCVRCGPSGRPAPAGSPLSDGHKHARALRAVAKAVLKELWRESRRLHEGGGPR